MSTRFTTKETSMHIEAILEVFHAARDVVTSEPATIALWQILVGVAGAITTVSVILGAVWWLLGPRVRTYIESIATQVGEIESKVGETHKSVTVNGGKSSPPTLLDKVHNLGRQVDQLIVVSGATAQRTSDLGDLVSTLSDRVSDVHDIAEGARAALTDHERRGEQYLGKVELVLRDKGIELPQSDR